MLMLPGMERFSRIYDVCKTDVNKEFHNTCSIFVVLRLNKIIEIKCVFQKFVVSIALCKSVVHCYAVGCKNAGRMGIKVPNPVSEDKRGRLKMSYFRATFLGLSSAGAIFIEVLG